MKRFFSFILGIFDSILKYFSTRKMEEALFTARLNHYYQDNNYDYSKVDERIKNIFNRLGIVTKLKITDLATDFISKTGLSNEIFESYIQVQLGDMHTEADVILAEWIKSDERIEVLHEAAYSSVRNKVKPELIRVSKRTAPARKTLFIRYEGSYLILTLKFWNSPFPHWELDLCKPVEMGSEFEDALQTRIDMHFIASVKAKILNKDFNELDFKLYERNQLIYPVALAKKIDSMITSFHNWYRHPQIRQWGSIFIGAPGTGKTSIGGLIAAQRPKDCTFIYAPACDLTTPSSLKRVFELAKKLSPCVVQIDDVDLISSDRTNSDDNKKAFTSAFMEELDGLTEAAKIFLIMTTNDPSKMDEAIINRAGRISNKIIFEGFGVCFVPLVSLYAEEYGLNLEENDLQRAADECKEMICEFTPDEAKNFCSRLSLMVGDKKIDYLQLVEVITETSRSFHDDSMNKSRLKRKVQVSNGNGKTDHAWTPDGMSS